ncbi:MAG: ATP-binding cassette domain-containing protein, partial [Candidatus Thorarchaeota archaeon]|nr:ATP-binding cassette domain-containing protein [Candidatus Thorarchaeota archaeon]
MSEDEILLNVKNLHAYYPSRKGLIKAVRDVSFTVKTGECLGVLGESGCGKSSMALSLVGLFNRMAKFAAGAAKSPGLLKEFEKEEEERKAEAVRLEAQRKEQEAAQAKIDEANRKLEEEKSFLE